jgi:O-antigen ligase
MNIVVILLTLLVVLSGNIQAILYIAGMFWLSKRAYSKTHTSIAFYLVLLIAYPQTFIGETDFDRNMPLLFSCLFLIHARGGGVRLPAIRLERWQIIVLVAFCLMSLAVYLPIVTATYLSLDLVNGAAEQFVANDRGSHMLSFVVPFIAAPMVTLGVMKGITDRSDFGRLYTFLKTLLWIVVLPSFLRYALEVDFIPQEYTPVRYEGNRLSAFMSPDSLGYGRRLLFPIALVAAYAISSRRYRNDFLLLGVLMVTVAMTLGRTTYVSSFVVLFFVMLHNVGVKRVLIVSAVAVTLATVLTVSGVTGAMLARTVGNDGGIMLSGRNIIWGAAIQALSASPFVGLRPGGWTVMLLTGNVTYLIAVGQIHTMVAQSAHSFYLQGALDWGIPIMVMLTAILIHSAVLMHTTARRLKHDVGQLGKFHIRNWAIATQAATCGLLVHGITEQVGYYLLFLLLGLSWSLYFITRRPSSFGVLLGASQ